MARTRRRRSELYPEFLSTQNLNPFSGHDSASRKQMFAGNMPQVLSLLTPTRRMMVTGMEREYGKYCFMVKMEHNCRVIEVLHRIGRAHGRSAIDVNPVRYVVYEIVEDKEREGEIGILEMPYFKSMHKRFGFNMIYDEELVRTLLYPGGYVKAGTVFARPATLSPSGEYMYGREARTAFMTMPAGIEDGALISESFANATCTMGFEERTISYGKEAFPLNLYGDDNVYKIHPDIGEEVGENGVLMALRSYDESIAAVQMTPKRLREIDRIFDKPIFATPGSVVVDVKVYHNADVGQGHTPVGMEYTDSRYDTAQRRFYNRIIELDAGFENSRKKDNKTSRDFHRLAVEAYQYLNPNSKTKRKVGYRRQEIDDWRVVITLREVIKPGMGIKITDTHGGKGVICKVMADKDMPRDQYGNLLDLVMDPMSLTKRMNIGRVIEPRINSVSMMITKKLREELGFQDVNVDEFSAHKVANEIGDDRMEEIKQYLLGYYDIVSPMMHDAIIKRELFNWRNHLKHILMEGLQLWLPTNNPVDYTEVIEELDRCGYHPNYEQVWFRARNGEMKLTKKKVMVGSLYIILLEKIGRDFAAVASAKLQMNGVPSRISSTDRNTSPVRAQPVRIAGETEVRLFLMAIGGIATRDLLDQTNNPDSHRMVIESIITAETPTDIDSVIDRRRHPMIEHRIMQQIKHLHECGGIEHYLEVDGDEIRHVAR